MIKERLTREDLASIIQNQLLYDKNIETRPISEILLEMPVNAAKSFLLTVGVGAGLTWSSSMFAFRRASIANRDVKIALPVLVSFSSIDFCVNFALTKASGKAVPTRGISAASGSIAGASLGYFLSDHKLKTTVFGGIAGALYGYLRNIPMEILGFNPY